MAADKSESAQSAVAVAGCNAAKESHAVGTRLGSAGRTRGPCGAALGVGVGRGEVEDGELQAGAAQVGEEELPLRQHLPPREPVGGQ